jgi:glycosyltransferase involved in cell wall biosynthesis
VCIVSNGLLGPVRNGGISTLYMGLAEALVEHGHEVTYLYTGGSYTESQPVHEWLRHHASRGIHVVALPESSIRLQNSYNLQVSYLTCEWLRMHGPFDVIHFHEWQGHGYYSLLSKHQGLAFDDTTLCVSTHSPTSWNRQGNHEFMDRVVDYETDYLERQSVALADILISSSRYMLDWLAGEGWSLPSSCRVIPNVLPASALARLGDASGMPSLGAPGQPVTDLVFFGRLEGRKGLALFCDALDRLVTVETGPFRVTFLGKDGTIEGRSGFDYVGQRARTWKFPWHTITSYDNVQAVDYLRQAGRLAIMPSLMDNSPLALHECLLAGIPFLASEVGGIPEMVQQDDHDAVLFPPHAGDLASRLARAIREGQAPARPAFDETRDRMAWVAWHGDLSSRRHGPRIQPLPGELPLVSICIPHYNRPGHLSAALESLRAQDYPNFEVIVVDDGSDRPEAQAYLESLEPEFSSRGWMIIRQANRFPGAARNNAARHARGEYLLFMDDDNFAKPQEISRFMQVALHGGADILTCFADVIEGQKPHSADQQPDSRWLYMGASLAVGAFYNCFGDTNSLWKTRSFRALGGFTEDRDCNHEDLELFARAVFQGYRLEVVPEALYWYRQNPSGVNLTTPRYRNALRGLRPYRDALPASLHHVLTYAHAHYVRSRRQPFGPSGEELGLESWPIRYRIADRINLYIKRLGPLHRLLRASLRSADTLSSQIRRPAWSFRDRVLRSRGRSIER